MKSIKIILSSLTLGFILLLNVFTLGGVAYAKMIQQPPVQNPTPATGGGGISCSSTPGKICNPIKAKSIDALLSGLLSIVKFVAGIVLVIYFILAGFKYVTARGDETKIKAAHSMLTWTAVGGAILLGAEVIQKLISGTISQLGTGL